MARRGILVFLLSMAVAFPAYADMELITAAGRGDTATVMALLEGGASVNARDKYGVTALMMASANGYPDTANLLIREGATINFKADNSMTALMAAEKGGYNKIVALLKGAGHPKTVTDEILSRFSPGKWRRFPVAMIVAALIIIAGQLLVVWFKNNLKNRRKKSVNIKTRDKNGITALMGAAMNGHVDIVRILLDNGVDKNAVSNKGDTALSLASSAGHADIVEVLMGLSAGEGINNSSAKSDLTGTRKIVELVKQTADME